MATHPSPPNALVDRLRAICLDLPEATEEAAWTGTRWSVSHKNFAHVVMIASGWPPAYAKAAASDGPLCVLTFRTPRPAAEIARLARAPYFLPRWWPDIAGMSLDARTEWDDVERHVVASYCVLAPRKLARWVEQTRGPF
jgi:hypothetical protein